jgi:hypothetical protein
MAPLWCRLERFCQAKNQYGKIISVLLVKLSSKWRSTGFYAVYAQILLGTDTKQ